MRLYCYVDESGQDTTAQPGRERLFIVAVVIFTLDRELLESVCEEYEQASGKGKAKWNQASPKRRLAFLQLIIHDKRFFHTLCYTHSRLPQHPEFDTCTISSIAKAIYWKQPPTDYTCDVFIDGISEAKQAQYAKELRREGLKIRRVHRARDESYALIRLADSLAGLAREALEGQKQDSYLLLQSAMRLGILSEI